MQVVKLRGEWRSHYALAGRSLLDIYDAFGRGDTGFSFPLMLNGQQQDIKLGFIVKQDIASLYMQAVGGLNRYAAQASSPRGPDSELFTKGVCQSLLLVTCIFETPCHLVRLFTEYLCKSESDRRSHTNGPAHTAFLKQQVQSICGCSPHISTIPASLWQEAACSLHVVPLLTHSFVTGLSCSTAGLQPDESRQQFSLLTVLLRIPTAAGIAQVEDTWQCLLTWNSVLLIQKDPATA